MTTRRDFVVGAGATGISHIAISGIGGPASADAVTDDREGNWDQGNLVHILPTVSHDRFLIKASFEGPLESAPELHVGALRTRGQRNVARGDFWQFDVSGLKSGTPYHLSLATGDGRPLCEPWRLSTFPAPDTMPSRLRLLIYTCGRAWPHFAPFACTQVLTGYTLR